MITSFTHGLAGIEVTLVSRWNTTYDYSAHCKKSGLRIQSRDGITGFDPNFWYLTVRSIDASCWTLNRGLE